MNKDGNNSCELQGETEHGSPFVLNILVDKRSDRYGDERVVPT